MKVIGFNFTKISIEKFSDNFSKINLKTNIDISEINEIKAGSFKIKEEIIGVKFNYVVEYEPNIAKLEFSGSILFAVDSKLIKEILKAWKDKIIFEEFKIPLFNIILKKANIKSIQLEEELNLPLHVPLPSLKKTESK